MRAEYQASGKPGETRIQSTHHAATKPVIAGIIYAVKALVSNRKLSKLGLGRSERSWGRGNGLQGSGKQWTVLPAASQMNWSQMELSNPKASACHHDWTTNALPNGAVTFDRSLSFPTGTISRSAGPRGLALDILPRSNDGEMWRN
jgi:hypothetical protein